MGDWSLLVDLFIWWNLPHKPLLSIQLLSSNILRLIAGDLLSTANGLNCAKHLSLFLSLSNVTADLSLKALMLPN